MKRRTYSELLAEVKFELALEEETTIKDNEFVQYCNDAIHETESTINDLRKDYFLKDVKLLNQSGTPGLVLGQSDYPFPADMHALKIREIVYQNANTVMEIKPFRRGNRLSAIAQINTNNSLEAGVYAYLIVNPSVYDPANPYTTGPMMRFIPTPLETGDYVTVWYLRSAQEIPYTNNTDTQIDIPEFYDFVKAAFRMKCAVKEGVPDLASHVEMYKLLQTKMIKSLRNRVDDDNDQVPMDMSSYAEFSGGLDNGRGVM